MREHLRNQSSCCSSASSPFPSFPVSTPLPPNATPRCATPPPATPQVQLSGGAHKASAITDDQGYFELDVAGVSSPSALSGSLLRLDRGGKDGDGDGECLDTAVGLPPPVSLGALVPIYEKGICVLF